MVEDERRRVFVSRLMRSEFERSLAENPCVEVVFVEHANLVVPAGIRPGKGGITILAYGLALPWTIPDLMVTVAGIRATLRFAGGEQFTFVPWDAVVDLVIPGKGSTSSVPSPSGSTSTIPKPAGRPVLSLVP